MVTILCLQIFLYTNEIARSLLEIQHTSETTLLKRVKLLSRFLAFSCAWFNIRSERSTKNIFFRLKFHAQ